MLKAIILFLLFSLDSIVNLAYFQGNTSQKGMDAMYFKSPEESVEIITKLLRKSDWVELTKYYDIAGSEVKKEEMLSGDYFINTERPEVAHPAGFWRYKHPFSPGFKYFSHKSIEDSKVEVVVQIEIDQGEGMIQKGIDTYYLKKCEKGFQLLPID